MELQFQSRTCRCLGRAVREIQNAEVTHDLRLSDGMPDIGRVLASWGQIVLRSKEWRGDQVTVTGGVMVWVLYAPEDGTDPRSVDAWIPFQLKWNLTDSGREGPVRIWPLLRFVDSRTVSSRKMMIRVGIAAMGEALYPMDSEISVPDELPEDLQILKEIYPVRLPKEAGEKTFLMDEDLSVKDHATPEKLLGYTFRPEISEKKIMANKLVFRGNGILHMIYRCGEGRIHTYDFELPFSQYAELDAEYGTDATADVQPAVTDLEVSLNEGGQVRLKCGMVAQYLVEDRELLILGRDAYSPFRTVEVKQEELILPSTLDDRTEQLKVHHTLPCQGGDVVDVHFLPDFPRQRRNDDQVQLEIPGVFQILYYSPEGMLQSANARWEEIMTVPAGEGTRLDVIPEIRGVPSAESRGEEFSMDGQLLMRLNATADQGIPMVTGLELGELVEPDPNRPSLILCRPEGASLWEIAKRCGSRVDDIRDVNGIEDCFEPNRMLLIPIC